MVSAETLLMLGKAEPREDRDLGPDWLNRYPIVQLSREDFTGDARQDTAMVLRAIKDATTDDSAWDASNAVTIDVEAVVEFKV